MTDTDTSITIKVPVEVSKRSYPKGWRARVGVHEAEATTKPAVMQVLREQVVRALISRGGPGRVTVAGDAVYVLACGVNGQWSCTSAKLGDSGTANLRTLEWTDATLGSVDAGARFDRYVAGFAAREVARPLRDETSRLLHILAATGQDTTRAASETAERLAVITGFAVAGMRAELESLQGHVVTSDRCTATSGMSPEGQALARLLGLYGGDVPVRVTDATRRILASTHASRWSGTFADLADVVGGTDPLDVLARAFEALDDPEQRVMDTGGPADDGPIAKHHEDEVARERKSAQEEGIEAAETAWKKHVAAIRKACEALDDAIAGLDVPEDDLVAFDAALGDARDAVRAALDDEVEEVTVDD